MGVGQEPGSDTSQDTDSVNNPISVSDGINGDKKGEGKVKTENSDVELAGDPWPVSSNSNVIINKLTFTILLTGLLLRLRKC